MRAGEIKGGWGRGRGVRRRGEDRREVGKGRVEENE
jgi:hypothetical protein